MIASYALSTVIIPIYENFLIIFCKLSGLDPVEHTQTEENVARGNAVFAFVIRQSLLSYADFISHLLLSKSQRFPSRTQAIAANFSQCFQSIHNVNDHHTTKTSLF